MFIASKLWILVRTLFAVVLGSGAIGLGVGLVGVVVAMIIGFSGSVVWLFWTSALLALSYFLIGFVVLARSFFAPVEISTSAFARKELIAKAKEFRRRKARGKSAQSRRKGHGVQRVKHAAIWMVTLIVVLIVLLPMAALGPFGLLVGIPSFLLIQKFLGSRLDASKAKLEQLRVPFLEQLRWIDRRPPIVLFRSFQDDQLTLINDEGDSKNWGKGLERFEEFICRDFSSYGPSIAIGDPRESLPPLGAARAYFSNDEWKLAALDYMEDATAIVLILGLTPSVHWELEQAIRLGYGAKLVVIIPPDTDANVANQRLDACFQMLMKSGVVLEKIHIPKSLSILGIVFDKELAPLVIASKSARSFAYREMLALAVGWVATNSTKLPLGETGETSGDPRNL